MADAATTLIHSVLRTTLDYMALAIVMIASFLVVIFILCGGFLLGVYIWRYAPKKKAQANEPPPYAEASASSSATAEEPATFIPTKEDDSVGPAVAVICFLGCIVHLFAILNPGEHNTDSDGKLLPGGWTEWQRIAVTLLAYVILAVAWILFMAGLRAIVWLIQWRNGRGKTAEASYHKLEDLEPAMQSEPVQKLVAAEQAGMAV